MTSEPRFKIGDQVAFDDGDEIVRGRVVSIQRSAPNADFHYDLELSGDVRVGHLFGDEIWHVPPEDLTDRPAVERWLRS